MHVLCVRTLICHSTKHCSRLKTPCMRLLYVFMQYMSYAAVSFLMSSEFMCCGLAEIGKNS
jgi:hypothetical protein